MTTRWMSTLMDTLTPMQVSPHNDGRACHSKAPLCTAEFFTANEGSCNFSRWVEELKLIRKYVVKKYSTTC